MTAAAAIGTPASEGSAPSGSEGGVPTVVQPESAEPQDSASPERSDLNALLDKRKPPKPKGKAAKGPGDEDTDPGPDPDADEETDPDAEEPAEAKAPDPKEITAEQLFSDDALKTPEGVKRAREIVMFAKAELEKRHRRFDRADIKLKAREKAVSGVEARGKQVEQLARAFQAELHTIAGLRETDQFGILRALDRLSGGNGSMEAGRELYEAMAMAYAREGKLPEKTRGERELETRIERMQREQAEREKAREDEQLESRAAHLSSQIEMGRRMIRTAATNATAYPSIGAALADAESEITAESVAEYIEETMVAHHERTGEPLDMGEAIGILERKLARHYGQRAPQGETAAASHNRPRQGAPKRAAPTVLPASADLSSGRGRPLSREERLDELARDPSFFEELGPGFRQHAGL